MPRPLILENFAEPPLPSAPHVPELPQVAVPALSEDDRLAAFEKGYQNGWDDCIAADAENSKRVTADLAANLREISTTNAEARQEVLTSLTPFFDQLVAQFLPALAAEALAPTVRAALSEVAETAAQSEGILTVAPGALPALETLVDTEAGLEIKLEVEPAYAEGQVSIRFGDDRQDINLNEAVERMASAIRDFMAHQLGLAPEMTSQPDISQEYSA